MSVQLLRSTERQLVVQQTDWLMIYTVVSASVQTQIEFVERLI